MGARGGRRGRGGAGAGPTTAGGGARPVAGGCPAGRGEARDRWRTLTLAIGGADLVAAGVAPGPAIGRALRAARGAVLDGRATTREEQIRTALAAAR